MPKKATLWFSLNMVIGCLVEACQYLKAIFEIAEDPPEEIIQRLSQIIEVLPACMNTDNMKFEQEELASVGIHGLHPSQIGTGVSQSERSQHTYTGGGSEQNMSEKNETCSTNGT